MIRHQEPLWSKPFVLLFAANAALFLAFEMLIPTLPLYAESAGANDSQIGLVTGVFTMSAIVSRPFTAVLSVRLGRRRLLALAIAICLVSTLGYSFAGTYAPLMAVRLLHGVGFGLATNLFSAMAADLLPSDRRGEGVGHFSMGETLSISLGPLVGVALMNGLGFDGMFGVGAAILFATLLLTAGLGRRRGSMAWTTEAEAAAKAEAAGAERTASGEGKPSAVAPYAAKPSLRSSLFEPQAFTPAALALLLGLSVGAVISFITIFAREEGLAHVEWFLFANALAGLLVRIVSGPLFDRKGPAWVLVPAGLFGLAGHAAIAAATGTPSLIVAAVLCGIGTGAAFPALEAWVLGRVPARRREAALGFFFNAFDLGIGCGSIVFGAVAGVIGYRGMYAASALVYVAYLAIFLGYAASAKSRQRSAAVSGGRLGLTDGKKLPM